MLRPRWLRATSPLSGLKQRLTNSIAETHIHTHTDTHIHKCQISLTFVHLYSFLHSIIPSAMSLLHLLLLFMCGSLSAYFSPFCPLLLLLPVWLLDASFFIVILFLSTHSSTCCCCSCFFSHFLPRLPSIHIFLFTFSLSHNTQSFDIYIVVCVAHLLALARALSQYLRPSPPLPPRR